MAAPDLDSPLRRAMRRLMRLTRRLVALLAIAYSCALLLVIALFRFGGERFWQVELGLYFPRLVFAAPLPFFVLLLLILRMWKWLWSQLLAALIIVFPLMGCVVSWPAQASEPNKVIRVMSYNGNFAYGGEEHLARQVLDLDPDIAVFQQLFATDKLSSALAARYRALQTNGEFFVASRFPIRSTFEPEKLPHGTRLRSARFVKYELATKIGAIALYNMHPISPSYQMGLVRRGGLRRAIATGSLFSLETRPDIQGDTLLRALQTRAVADAANRESVPVIIAGDTNLPHLSGALTHLANYQDGFSASGFGFGYTFPSKRPWMRIDRIFASRDLRFVRFEVGSSRASDHFCVAADLERRAR